MKTRLVEQFSKHLARNILPFENTTTKLLLQYDPHCMMVSNWYYGTLVVVNIYNKLNSKHKPLLYMTNFSKHIF